MGRPRTYSNRVTTAIRFERDLHERLDVAAAERDVSINWLVTRAVEQFLDRLVPVDEWLDK